MYLLLIALLVGAGVALWHRGYRRQSAVSRRGGIALLLGTAGLLVLMALWAEALWFTELGYGERFWTFLGARIAGAVIGAMSGFAGVWLLHRGLGRAPDWLYPWPELVGAAGGMVQGSALWDEALLFLNREPAGVAEPVLGLDAGFYLFVLPFLDAVWGLLLWIVVIGALAVALRTLLARSEDGELNIRSENGPTASQLRPLLLASAALGVVVALGLFLQIFHLLFSTWGVVAGPGWTDVHVRLPGYIALGCLTLLLTLSPLVPVARRMMSHGLQRFLPQRAYPTVTVLAPWAAVAASWMLIMGLLPSLVQWLLVEPNEITLETPYLSNNIEMTRYGFGLHRTESRQYPADGELSRSVVDENRHLISEVRLWDWRALDAVYKQFQEIRLYYEFVDLDMDRYHFDGGYRQMITSARELAQENLPDQSQTFVNQRFKYTHGYGVTLSTVSDFTPEGLPNLLVRDIPPVSEYPELEVRRPEIYYGELTDEPVVVNTEEPEFDYPRGDKNAYTRYQGDGGVPMRNLWRKFIFGWKFDGTPFLFSTYPTAESRVMFHRSVADRVQRLAPFLALDEDPYVVLVDGRLYWIVDAYTRSKHFPYSEPFDAPRSNIYPRQPGQVRTRATGIDLRYLDGANYVRNSVKVVVDAYQGSVDFYVYDAEDPLIRAWRNVLPGMFKDRGDMPEGMQRHVRYPQGFLLTQGLVYAKYHMQDPAVFYNQEDLWVRATEKYHGDVQPVEPYYIMWELPDSDEAEFVLMLPFTPKNRQVLIGWIAGLSDGENYGRFLAYKFPKEKRVLGPQQVETKIDQDRQLSGQLTLWDQRGSRVIRGNVLAIPLNGTLLYVEPIYLQAETAAYPELRLVVVMHQDHISYAESFDEALAGLFIDGRTGTRTEEEAPASLRALARQAEAAFERYLQAQGDGRFRDAADALDQLQGYLSQMSE